MSTLNAITSEVLGRLQENYEENKKFSRMAQGAMARTEIKDLAYLPHQAAKLNGDFTVEVKTRGITAQMRSGRCWMFSTLNILREIVAEKCNLDEFKISANYLTFFDKLEKANNMMEMAIANADKPMDDRMTEYILDGFGDGGYWDMAADLVKKYGAVPAWVMPETYQSEHTEKFMRLLKTLLRKNVSLLRKAAAEGGDTAKMKEEMLAEIYRMECIVFGEPTKSFNFEYRDKDGEYHCDRNLTPKAFYEKYIGADLDNYITVTNHPTDGLPMNCYYKFHYMGSMAEGDVYNINLTMDELEELCIRQLQGGEPVWFGCDSGAYGDRQEGVWDPDSFDYDTLFGGVDFDMDKKDRLMFHESFATHAMILVGVNMDEKGRPDRWKIENSWGGEVGKKGYFVCSEKYFKEYVYEAIINKKYLTQQQAALLEKQPEEIRAWESDWV